MQLIEKTNGAFVDEKRFAWCGYEVCQERASDGALKKEFFAQGEALSTTNVFYTRDHLGSIRELTDDFITIRARYSYSPFGVAARVGGDLESDFGFTGHYRHVTPTLGLTLYRAYDAPSARWLSRDPLGE